MEEALWSLEDKWKVSTHKAIALFACTCLLVMSTCIAMALRRRRRRRCKESVPPRWAVVKALMGSVRWSKWEGSRVDDVGNGWHSHNSCSALWQRPILMGEKCELPRYSGLIMYDHKGMPLPHYQGLLVHQQEMLPPVVTATLRDLL